MFSYKHRVFSLASGQEQDFVDYSDSRDYYRNEFIEYRAIGFFNKYF